MRNEQKYRVVVVGLGKRGMHHAEAFQANKRFEVVGLCDLDKARLDAVAANPLTRKSQTRWTTTAGSIRANSEAPMPVSKL